MDFVQKWTLLLLTMSIATSSALECSEVGHDCFCFENDNTDIQCPKLDSKIRISVLKDHKVEMQCLEDLQPHLDIESIPSINMSDAKYFKMQFCFLNNSFADILLGKFHMQNLESLTFEGVVHWDKNQEITISKESLEFLQSLKELKLMFSSIKLKPDFLANTPDLISLTFRQTSLAELDRYFDYVPKLRLLELSSNLIDVLPDRIFEKLSNLSELMLFSNKISILSNMTFKGLDNLKLLELSVNQIQDIPEGTFSRLQQLRILSLRGNKIKIIQKHTFSGNSLLEDVRLSNNPGLVLEDGVFANMTSLRTVDLSYNKFTEIPESTFENCHKLEEIDLSNNQLTSIADQLFEDLTSLKLLDMSNNKLASLPDGVFAPLVKLNELILNNNLLTTITDRLLRSLDELTTLNLQKNKIAFIEHRAFSSLEKLINLDLSFNKWNNTYSLPISPLGSLLSIKVLNLKQNQLVGIPDLISTLHIKELDLSYNQIEYLPLSMFVHKTDNPLEINLSYNKLSEIDFKLTEYLFSENIGDYDDFRYNKNITTIHITGNPIQCDCSMYDLARYNNDETHLKVLINIVQNETVCANDNKTAVLNVKPNQIECPSISECDSGCRCSYKPFYNAMIVNCSFSGLKSYPEINFSSDVHEHNQTFMILRGNNLTEGPSGNEENYENVTILDLSKNAISEIDWIPYKILELNLEENQLENLNHSLIQKLKNATSLRKLTLGSNPWHCNCKSADLQKFLMQYYFKVNSSDVYCENFKTELVKKTDICKISPYLSIFLPVILAVLLMFALAIALYYRYKTEIKIYLFAKNLCLWFVTEEELDKDKTYDVFISYAHPDEKFVEEHLLPELERRNNPYKVCIHIRDWVPGEFIAEQVVNSVRDSRRTLVVLSNNFVNSVWGKLEFRTAHTQAISEGRARVVVVIYGDLDESKLDDELKSYLKTNTYVKWGDKYFWNKLKYALPHSRGNFYKANRKVMLKIDDKFDLVKNPPSPCNTSTPPITLDPALLNTKHLALDLARKIEGENPLLNKEV